MEKFLGRLKAGWGWRKVACWSTEAAISLKRIKIEEKLLWRAYRKFTNALSNGIPDTQRPRSPSPRLGVHNPNPKLQSLLSQEWVNLAGTFTGSIKTIKTKAHKNLGEKGLWAYPGCPIFWVAPIISGTGIAVSVNCKFCTHILTIDRNKSPLKILAKVVVGVLRDCRNFSGHPARRIAWSPLR